MDGAKEYRTYAKAALRLAAKSETDRHASREREPRARAEIFFH
jgi:hypothetical protein